MPSIPHVGAHSVEISDGVALLRTHSGSEAIEQAMSVRALTKLADRCQRALRRYAKGEQSVIEGEG